MKKLIYPLGVVFPLLFITEANARTENWYTYWGIGVAQHQHPKELQNIMDAAESLPGVERSEMSIDALGFYVPVLQMKTLAGFVISGSLDRLEFGSDYIQLNQYLYSASMMHFMGSEPGDGVFLRGDLGISRAVAQTNDDASASDTGVGALLGFGYGFKISEESRLIIGVNYGIREIEDEIYSNYSFNIAGLW